MGTFTISTLSFDGGCVHPFFLQFLTIKIPGTEISGCIISPAHHKTWFLPVQIGNTCQIAFASVSVTVTPCWVWDNITTWFISYGREFFTGASFKNSQVLRTGFYDPFLTTIGSTIIGSGIVTAHYYMVSLSINGSRGCLTSYFGFAVTVQIIDHKLSIVSTGTDINSQIYSP